MDSDDIADLTDMGDGASQFDFSSDQAARESMKQFIKSEFDHIIGDKVELLDEDNGFEKLRKAFEAEINDASANVHKNIDQLLSLLSRLG